MEHLLYLVHRIPYPPNKGDKVRSYNLLKYLTRHYKVHLGTFIDDENDWQYIDTMKSICGETFFAPLNPKVAKIKSLTGLLIGDPLTLPYYRNKEMAAWVDGILENFPIKRVLVFSSAMAQYVMGASSTYRLADFVDIDSDKWLQYSRSKRWPLSSLYRREAKTLLRYERKVAQEFDATVFVSKAESELFKQMAPTVSSKVFYINNGVDSEYFSPSDTYVTPYHDDEHVIIFTGAMDYWPNIDAVEWFARDIFPAILLKQPAARFYIVGARPSPQVLKLGELPGVKVTGPVPDMRPYLAHAEVAVAPLRLARGVQNKVLEAMAMAKPVIASPEAAEGIDASIGEELLIADDAAAFIALTLRILSGKGGDKMSVAARERMLSDYDWNENLGRIRRLLQGQSLVPVHHEHDELTSDSTFEISGQGAM